MGNNKVGQQKQGQQQQQEPEPVVNSHSRDTNGSKKITISDSWVDSNRKDIWLK
jgi:hypothetical protein